MIYRISEDGQTLITQQAIVGCFAGPTMDILSARMRRMLA